MNTYAANLSDQRELLFEKKTITLSTKWIVMGGYLYMVLPIIIFFGGWLEWYVSIPSSIVLISGLFCLFQSVSKNFSEKIVLPARDLFLVICLIFLWIYTTSIFFYQTWDQHCRNAILRDLIDFQWPIVYEATGNALVYYYIHWLIPALCGKLFGFTVANVVLLVQNAFGVILVFLCLCVYIAPQKQTHFWVIFIILLFFGGLNDFGYMWIDILGKGAYQMGNGFGWPDWFSGYQYTPNDALLAWVYNQTIVPWIATTIFLLKPKISYFAFLGLCVLPFGPIPFVGLSIIMFTAFIVDMLRIRDKMLLKEVFSIPNICATLTILPIFFLFYKVNCAAQHLGFYTQSSMLSLEYILFFLVFYLLEFGIYMLLIRNDYLHSVLFWTVLISLVIIPHIQLGYGRDFCMRASIPALFVLMVLIIRYLINHDIYVKTPVITCLLIICLTISGMGTVKDWANKIKAVRINHWSPVLADDIKTYSDKQIGDLPWLENYLVPNPYDKVFFKYLAR